MRLWSRLCAGNPDDEKYHAHIHAEHLLGPVIPAVYQLSPCATDGTFSIYCVDVTCPKEIRRELARVAIVACRSMPGYPVVGYDGSVSEDDQRLFVVADGAHIVAMALTVLDDRFWRFTWKTDNSVILIDQEPSSNQRHKVARVWTAATYRRKGLAFRLIQTASRLLPCEMIDLGWELPFTPSGARLVKRLRPKEFWGSGDSASLREIIQAVREY